VHPAGESEGRGVRVREGVGEGEAGNLGREGGREGRRERRW
jgi:hypothetical protein